MTVGNKKIGVVSGMGAAAGARMLSMLVEKCQQLGAVRDSDFPEVFLHSISSAGMDEAGLSDPSVTKNVLADSVQLLNRLGADVILIACNTVSVHLKYLRFLSRAEIPSIIDTTLEYLRDKKKVGIISSRSTKKAGLYENPLAELGIKCVCTTGMQQGLVDDIIGKVIRGAVTTNDQEVLFNIVCSMKDEGAEKVVLGCTELPLVGIPVSSYIDPSKKLIESILSK